MTYCVTMDFVQLQETITGCTTYWLLNVVHTLYQQLRHNGLSWRKYTIVLPLLPVVELTCLLQSMFAIFLSDQVFVAMVTVTTSDDANHGTQHILTCSLGGCSSNESTSCHFWKKNHYMNTFTPHNNNELLYFNQRKLGQCLQCLTRSLPNPRGLQLVLS